MVARWPALVVCLTLSAPGFAQDDEPCRTDCAESTLHSCPCPAGCDQSYCEQACPWIGCHTCTTQCQPCTCGGFGIAGRRDTLAGLPGASGLPQPSTGQSQVIAGPPSGGKLVIIELGTFIIHDGPTKTANQDVDAGIGVKIAIKDGALIVLEVEPESPAFKAGIEAGQAILAIGRTPTAGLDLERAARALRGKAGSRVVLRLADPKRPAGRRVSITRESPRPRAGRRAVNGVGVRELRLKNLGRPACPSTHEQCLLLSPSGDYCVYACR